MNAALPKATVTGYEQQFRPYTLLDPDDRPVAATAIEADAPIIVTWNLDDFPVAELREHSLAQQSPDVFLVDLCKRAPDRHCLLNEIGNLLSPKSQGIEPQCVCHDGQG
ncbi:hypothetical protein [Kozakia baliensis]|uniref:hypothetical protein n=1 Tax=Kozakia baliensis TaxID=153496 RepID=UPI0038CFD044